MIDREARRQLASAIKNYATGKITNDDYMDLVLDLAHSQDASVAEIARDTYIGVDDPYREIRLTVKNRLNKKSRRNFARCVLFLRSASETRKSRWPAGWRKAIKILNNGLVQLIMLVLTCGLNVLIWTIIAIVNVFRDRFWPFANQEDFQAALHRPHLGAKNIWNP